MPLDLVFEMCSCTLYSLFHFRLSLKDAKKDFMSLFILNISANAMGHHFTQITQDCFKAYESEGKYCAKESFSKDAFFGNPVQIMGVKFKSLRCAAKFCCKKKVINMFFCNIFF